MIFDWNDEKNNQLKDERHIGFEDIIVAIEEGNVLDILEHPNKKKYDNQYLLIVEIDSYAFVIPSVINDDFWF